MPLHCIAKGALKLYCCRTVVVMLRCAVDTVVFLRGAVDRTLVWLRSTVDSGSIAADLLWTASFARHVNGPFVQWL